MSLLDLIMCECGHPAHAHPWYYPERVWEQSIRGACREDGCACGAFLERRRKHRP